MVSPTGISQGVQSVDQIRVDVAPDWPPRELVAGPSMITLAMLLLSWPVTTRRIGGNFGSVIALLSLSFSPRRRRGIGAIAAAACHPSRHAPLVRRTDPAALWADGVL